MITVKFLGGAKKSFSTDEILINQDHITIKELLNHLQENKPKNTQKFDTNNILVAINGIDSSTMAGYSTKLKTNDVVSIIPIIHGGSTRTQFTTLKSQVELVLIKNKAAKIDFLNTLRKKFPKLFVRTSK